MSTTQLIQTLKQNGEDFEFYPTTQSMINTIIEDLSEKAYSEYKTSMSLLEIGAGDCRVSQSFKESDKLSIHEIYAIEKATIHIKNLPDNITLVGTEFLETNLAGVEADIVFCNPPYSEYELWASNIITNSFASVIYLIIPQRWATSSLIASALKQRNMVAKILATDDFFEADRKARGQVNILRVVKESTLLEPFKIEEIESSMRHYYYDRMGKEFMMGKNFDPLNDMFSDFEEFDENSNPINELKEKTKEVFATCNVIEDMVAFYNKDLEKLQKDFLAISEMSPKLLRMVGVSRETLTNTVRNDIKNLKYAFWDEFLNHYEPITSRLTTKSRESFYSKVLKNAKKIDFTVSNCYAMTILAIEKANAYTDQQFKDLFLRHADVDNLKAYKSNQRVFDKKDYRYLRDEEKLNYFQKAKLEYRMVCSYHVNWSSYTNQYTIKNTVNDYIVVAKTLMLGLHGVDVDTNLDYYQTGEKITVSYFKDHKLTELFDIRFYKKGTYHVRLSKEFALRLNVAIGKVFGWVDNAEQASYELDEDLESVKAYFYTSQHIITSGINILGIEFKPQDGQASCDIETIEESSANVVEDDQLAFDLDVC